MALAELQQPPQDAVWLGNTNVAEFAQSRALAALSIPNPLLLTNPGTTGDQFWAYPDVHGEVTLLANAETAEGRGFPGLAKADLDGDVVTRRTPARRESFGWDGYEALFALPSLPTLEEGSQTYAVSVSEDVLLYVEVTPEERESGTTYRLDLRRGYLEEDGSVGWERGRRTTAE